MQPRMRLTPDTWLDAGFAALIRKGPAALAAEPLARQIGTTKGSFYWHFKDVPAYHAALCERWRSRALSALSDAVGAENAPDHRLRAFGYGVLDDPTETAMRLWAQTDSAIAKSLRQVDEARLTYITLLLRELGLGNADFAHAVQATLIGLPQLSDDAQTRHASFDTLVDTVLAL